MIVIKEVSQKLMSEISLYECINDGELLNDAQVRHVLELLRDVKTFGLDYVETELRRMVKAGIRCADFAEVLLALKNGDYPYISQEMIAHLSSYIKVMIEYRENSPNIWLVFFDAYESRKEARERIQTFPVEKGEVTAQVSAYRL